MAYGLVLQILFHKYPWRGISTHLISWGESHRFESERISTLRVRVTLSKMASWYTARLTGYASSNGVSDAKPVDMWIEFLKIICFD